MLFCYAFFVTRAYVEFNLFINSLSSNPEKCSTSQLTILRGWSLSLFDHFVGLALQGVRNLYFFNLFPKSEVNGVSWVGGKGGEGGFNADIAIWSPKLCVQI